MTDPMADIFKSVFSAKVPLIDPWADSIYRPILSLSPGEKGKLGQRMIETLARREGFCVNPRPRGSDADLIIDNTYVEVKLSLRWTTGYYSFEQIRDQKYDVIVLLGIEPERTHLWTVPKAIIWEHARGEHGGRGAVDTKWLRFPATSPPTWLAAYGGLTPSGVASMKRLVA